LGDGSSPVRSLPEGSGAVKRVLAKAAGNSFPHRTTGAVPAALRGRLRGALRGLDCGADRVEPAQLKGPARPAESDRRRLQRRWQDRHPVAQPGERRGRGLVHERIPQIRPGLPPKGQRSRLDHLGAEVGRRDACPSNAVPGGGGLYGPTQEQVCISRAGLRVSFPAGSVRWRRTWSRRREVRVSQSHRRHGSRLSRIFDPDWWLPQERKAEWRGTPVHNETPTPSLPRRKIAHCRQATAVHELLSASESCRGRRVGVDQGTFSGQEMNPQ
jgi:hypothetical protein